MVAQLQGRNEELDQPAVLIADNGYFSEANVKACNPFGIAAMRVAADHVRAGRQVGSGAGAERGLLGCSRLLVTRQDVRCRYACPSWNQVQSSATRVTEGSLDPGERSGPIDHNTGT